MSQILTSCLMTNGAVPFLMGDTIASEVYAGAQGYTATFPRGTTTAVATTDVYNGGARYTQGGILRLYDATAALPSGYVNVGGMAFSSTGQLCYTTAAPDSSSQFIGGVACKQDGTVHASPITPAAWYRSGTGFTTATGVSAWADQSGNSRTLAQATGTKQPLQQSDGSLLFDGSDDFLQATFTLNQPCTFYLLFKQITWTSFDRVMDAGAATVTDLFQGGGAAPGLRCNAGSTFGLDSSVPMGTYEVVTVVFNGASSIMQVNQTSQTAAAGGANNPGGITLAADVSGTSNGNVQIREVMIAASAHDQATRNRIAAYMMALGGVS